MAEFPRSVPGTLFPEAVGCSYLLSRLAEDVMTNHSGRCGFTFIHLLVVVAIIAFLIAMLIPYT